MIFRRQHLLKVALIIFIGASRPATLRAERISPPLPAAISDSLSAGLTQDIIVLFDDRDVEAEAATLRQRARKTFDDDTILAVRRARYRSLKQSTTASFPDRDVEALRDYDHLPLTFVRVRNRNALDRLLADQRVRAVYENRPVFTHLAYSLPFIGQPTVAGTGFTGSAGTVAVIDSGIDYTLAAFGSCSIPGVPAGCKVAAAVDVNGNTNLVTTAKNHGTNVSGIVLGVAPGARVASFNALPGGAGTTSDVIAGINWAIGHKSAYNITALNMSLGDGSSNPATCSDPLTNPYVSAINGLRSAGILPVASSGNDGFASGIASPACTPGVVSVGAVYDASWRTSPDPSKPFSYTACTETALAAPDKITCFSNSVSFLTILAPGAFVTAAGIQMAGTSQAAPHVAGAMAVLRAAYAGDTLDQTVGHLTTSGVSITDSRNGIATPRLNLLAAFTPINNLFADRTLLAGDSGHVSAHNLNATKESGEPAHAGNSGGKSVWWRWNPTVSGEATFDTHGSAFNTLLAVYSGTSLSGLSQIAANDNDGSSGSTSGVGFTALAGTEYLIAVDGFNGAAGGIGLNWSLVQQADLGISIAQHPESPCEGDNLTYSMTVTNYGPSAASGVVVADQLPAGCLFVSASSGCIHSAGTVTCDLGTLARDAVAAVQIVVYATATGSLINVVQVGSEVSDPQTANNSTTASVAVSQAPAVPAFSPWGLGAAFICLAGVAGSRNNRRKGRL